MFLTLFNKFIQSSNKDESEKYYKIKQSSNYNERTKKYVSYFLVSEFITVFQRTQNQSFINEIY